VLIGEAHKSAKHATTMGCPRRDGNEAIRLPLTSCSRSRSASATGTGFPAGSEIEFGEDQDKRNAEVDAQI
jgi:hypothetical protein